MRIGRRLLPEKCGGNRNKFSRSNPLAEMTRRSQKKPCSSSQNDLESSLLDLARYINISCCIWRDRKGNEALPECWQCLQDLQQQNGCFHCVASVLCHGVIRFSVISFSINVISLIHFSSSY